MNEFINVMSIGVIATLCIFWILYSARMVAILILLMQHGQRGSANLEGIYTHRVGLGRRYYYVYQYSVEGKNYITVEIVTSTLGNRLLTKPTERAILYVKAYPQLSGRYYARPFLAIMALIFAPVGFFFTTIVGLSLSIDLGMSYGIWLLIVLGMVASPRLATLDVFRRYFEANVPQDAVRQDIR